jgi:uncharacterized protein YgiM (DUF1202 family)
MKRVLVLLVVLALVAVSSVALVAAQGGPVSGTQLSAVTLDPVTLYAEPSDASEAVLELPANSIVSVLLTDPTQAWLEVETADGAGYAPAENFLVLDPVLLAQKSMVAASDANAGLFAERDFGSEILGSLSNGQVATVLGTSGNWVYVMLPDGTTSWAVSSFFEPLPADAQLAQVTIDSDNLGVFVEPNVTADIATTLPNGELVYIFGAEGEFTQVLASDGTMGYAVASSFTPLPTLYVEPEVSQAEAGVFAEPDFASDVLGSVPVGTAAYYVGAVDDFWIEVFAPGIGQGYTLIENFGPVYTTATVPTNGAVVRAGPNDSIYKAIGTLPAGTEVVVLGKSETGAWYKVLVPFSSLQFPFNGATGWMRDYLFLDQGESTVDPSVLAVVE